MVEFLALIAFLMALLFGFRRQFFFEPPTTRTFDPHDIRNFERVPSVFVNRPERIFFQMLNERLPRDCHALAKIRLEDVVRVHTRVKVPREVWRLRGRVKSRHLDFLVIDAQGLPLCAIELDGASHDGAVPPIADQLKDALLMQVNLKLWRVRVGENFDKKIHQIVENLNNQRKV